MFEEAQLCRISPNYASKPHGPIKWTNWVRENKEQKDPEGLELALPENCSGRPHLDLTIFNCEGAHSLKGHHVAIFYLKGFDAYMGVEG
jgi:hypothetical protein